MKFNESAEGKKYELTDEETREFGGHILHRIVALRNFKGVKKGDKGGWIESENNLSHDGNCWVYDDAKVYGFAKVVEDATVSGNSMVYGSSYVGGTAKVYGKV